MYDKSMLLDGDLTISRDFSSIIQWCVRKIPYLTTRWDDFTVVDFGTMLLTNIAYLYDIINVRADEAYLDNTAKNSNSLNYMRGLFEVMGEDIKLTQSCWIHATSISNMGEDIILPKLTTFKVNGVGENVYFNTVYGNLIPAGNNEFEIELIEGVINTLYIDINSVDEKDKIFVYDYCIASNLIVVSTDLGEMLRVDDAFIDGGKLCYSLQPNRDNSAVIRLSKGWKDELIGLGMSTIRIDYLHSNGVKGNIGIGTILKPGVDIYDMNGKLVTDVVTLRCSAAESAVDFWGVNECRLNIEDSFKSVSIMVNEGDFKRCVGADTRVCDIVSKIGNTSKDINYVTYEGGLSNTEKEDITYNISKYVEERSLAFTTFTVDSMIDYPLNLNIIIYLRANGIVYNGLERDINNTLLSFFDRSGPNSRGSLRAIRVAEVVKNSSPIIERVVMVNLNDLVIGWDYVFWYKGIESIEYRRSEKR